MLTAKDYYELSLLEPVTVPGQTVADWVNDTTITQPPYVLTESECANLRLALKANGEDPHDDARVLEIYDNVFDPANEALRLLKEDCISNFHELDGVNVPFHICNVPGGLNIRLKHGPVEEVTVRRWKGKDVREFAGMSEVGQSLHVLASSMGITFESLLMLHLADLDQCYEALGFLMDSGSDSPISSG